MDGSPPLDPDALESLRRRRLITDETYRSLAGLPPAPALRPAVEVAAPVAVEAPPLPRISFGLQLLAVGLALIGGVFGIIGAVFQELQHGFGLLGVFIAAPVIEEAFKPAGIYLLLLRWPQALLGRLHTAALTAISGLCFGLIESAVYVTLYYPEGDSDYVLFRFTVPVLLHTLASGIVGYGLTRGVIDWAAGRGPLPKSTRVFYLAAVALHAVYNTTAVILDLTGVLEF